MFNLKKERLHKFPIFTEQRDWEGDQPEVPA